MEAISLGIITTTVRDHNWETLGWLILFCTQKTWRNSRAEGAPCNEEDLALPAVIDGDEVEVEHRIPAIIGGQGSGEIVVAVGGAAEFIDGDESGSFVDLEHYVSVLLLPLHIHERFLAFIGYPHSSGCLKLNHWLWKKVRKMKLKRLIRVESKITILKAIAIFVCAEISENGWSGGMRATAGPIYKTFAPQMPFAFPPIYYLVLHFICCQFLLIKNMHSKLGYYFLLLYICWL